MGDEMKILTSGLISLAMFSTALAFAEPFNLGDLSKYGENSCPDDKGAFRVLIEPGGSEVVYEAPNPTHAYLFLICNITQSNNIRIRVDGGPDVGKINNVCMMATARSKLEVANSQLRSVDRSGDDQPDEDVKVSRDHRIEGSAYENDIYNSGSQIACVKPIFVTEILP